MTCGTTTGRCRDLRWTPVSRPKSRSADSTLPASFFRVLSRHISEGQINKVRDALPKSLRQMWVTAEDPTLMAREALVLTEEV